MQERAQETAQERAQAVQKAGRQASTRKAFSRSHALEGLVQLSNLITKLKKVFYAPTVKRSQSAPWFLF